MSENEWQVLVRGSDDEWRAVPDGRTAARLVRDSSAMFVQARVREVSPWRLMPETHDIGSSDG
jgi:hypothetical protein